MAMHVVFNVHFLLALSSLKTALLILSSQTNYLLRPAHNSKAHWDQKHLLN